MRFVPHQRAATAGRGKQLQSNSGRPRSSKRASITQHCPLVYRLRMEQVPKQIWTIWLLGLSDKTSEDMRQVNVKGGGGKKKKRSEVETLECTGSCDGEDLVSSSSHSLTRVSPRSQTHVTQSPNLVLLQYHGEYLFTTKIAAYSLESSPSRTGKWNEIQLAASCFSGAKKASALKPALMASRRHGELHSEPVWTLILYSNTGVHALLWEVKVTSIETFSQVTCIAKE